MDPNANLSEQLQAARALLAMKCVGTANECHAMTENQMAEEAPRLAELVIALHEWISAGGFLPDTWADGLNLRRKS